jgi:hypothetical protein
MDIIGRVFWRLTVISRHGKTPAGAATWNCKCSCGNVCIATGFKLRQGRKQSCGCWKKEFGVTHGMSRTAPEYKVWSEIIQRCTNPSRVHYRHYGGRGITVCPKWRHDFAAFLADMGSRPTPSHTVDRIDNNGNYEPDNCRWATHAEQMAHTSRSRVIEFSGESMILAEWARRLGIKDCTLLQRISRWGVAQALTRPKHNQAK